MTFPIVPSVTESQILTALRTFILQYAPPGTQVVQGQDNLVPNPPGPNWVTMTPLMRKRMATNEDAYFDPYLTTPTVPGTRTASASTQIDVQVDFYGNAASDAVQVFTTLFRSEVGVLAFQPSGATPLYTSDPRKIAFVNDQSQYESRWSVDVSINFDVNAAVPQDFTSTIDVGVVSVESAYPPT